MSPLIPAIGENMKKFAKISIVCSLVLSIALPLLAYSLTIQRTSETYGVKVHIISNSDPVAFGLYQGTWGLNNWTEVSELSWPTMPLGTNYTETYTLAAKGINDIQAYATWTANGTLDFTDSLSGARILALAVTFNGVDWPEGTEVPWGTWNSATIGFNLFVTPLTDAPKDLAFTVTISVSLVP